MLNCRATLVGPLRQRAETNCVDTLYKTPPIVRPFQRIPGYRMRDVKLGDSLFVELHFDCPGGTLPIGLHMIDVEPQLFHTPQGFESLGILAHTAGHNSLIAHEGGDVGEVCWGPSQARAFWQKIPQHFPQPNDFLFHDSTRALPKTFTAITQRK